MNKKCIISVLAALMCCLTVFAQEFVPTEGRTYQFINHDADLALAQSGKSAVLKAKDNKDLSQLWLIEEVDDLVRIKNVGTGEYLGMQTAESWNTWDTDFFSESDVNNVGDKAKFTITALANGDYAFKLQSNGKYLGFDNITEGSKSYLDKGSSNHYGFTIAAVGAPLSEVFNNAVERVQTYIEDNLSDFGGLAEEDYRDLEMFISLYEFYFMDPNFESEEYDDNRSRALELFAYLLDKAKKQRELIDNIFALQSKFEDMVEVDETLPGIDEFIKFIDAHNNQMEESYSMTSRQFEQLYADMNEALRVYYNSIYDDFREGSDLDVTMFMKNPNFTVDGNPSTSGWILDNVYSGGKDFGAYQKGEEETGRNVICMNEWSDNFTRLNVYQDIEGLKPGMYVITCNAWSSALGNQHAYVQNSLGLEKTSDYATEAILSKDGTWESFRTEPIYVQDGKLRAGFMATSEGGSTAGWFLVTEFRLLCVSTSPQDADYMLLQSLIEEAEAIEVMIPRDKEDLDVRIMIAKHCKIDDPVEDIRLEIDYLKKAIDDAKWANEQYWALINGQYAELLRAIEAEEEGSTIRAAYEEIRKKADEMMKVYQANRFCQIADEIFIEMILAEIDEAGTENANYTFLIKNPDIQNSNDSWVDGWTINKGEGNKHSNAGQHYLKDTGNRYLDSWNSTAGALKYTASQTLENIPNGTYHLEAAVRADGEGAYLYAETGGTKTIAAIKADGDKGGDIYNVPFLRDSLALIEQGYTDEQIYEQELLANYPIASYGWNNLAVDNIVVTNHTLTIGVTTDSAVSGGEPFAGTWFSADDFVLILVENGDNENWNPVGIQVAEKAESPAVPVAIYSLSGLQRQSLEPGINIVKMSNGQTKKIFIK